MDSGVGRELERAARVREFLEARSASESSYAPVLVRVGGLLKRAGEIAARQHQGQEAAHAARAHRKEIRLVVHSQLMHYLVAVGAFATADQRELADRFKLPSRNLPNAAFLVSVKSLIELARSKQDVLVQQGLKPEVLDELDVKVAEFEAAAEAARTGRRNHIGAGAEMEQVLVELRKEIKLADGITRYRFGMDPDTMKEWKAVRRLPARARPDGGAKPQQSSGEAPAA